MKRRSFAGAMGMALLGVGGCSGQSCSSLAPLPGGFPAAARVPNATQVRLSQTGVAALVADPKVVARQLFGPALAIDVAPSCGASSPVCCPSGTPVSPCGPVAIDVDPRVGDQPRVVLTPVQGTSRVDVTLRARVKTVTDVPITVPSVGTCGLHIDTTAGTSTPEDIQLSVPLNMVQDATAGTTRWSLGAVAISGLTTSDFSIVGSLGCQVASLGLSFLQGTLTSMLEDQLRAGFEQSLCKACPSGSVAGCGTFADACTNGTCMEGNQCLQELGVLGRLAAGKLFGGAPPGSAGSLDLYEVAGGYATTNAGGVALGVLAGSLPSGAPRDRCGPAAAPPAPGAVPQSSYFQGNTRPDTGAPFDVGIGLHSSQLVRFAHAAYEGGVLCPTVGTSELPTFGSASLAAAIPSLAGLTGGDVPVAVGLRPQSPPAVTLGANTFDAADAVVEPLVDLAFSGMEIDLFATVERQPIRVLTVVADVGVPLGMRTGAVGTLEPVLGTVRVQGATVKASEALTESPAALAAVAPALLDRALPELVRRVGPLPLPTALGMPIQATAATAVDGNAFVGIFGALVPPPALGAGAPAPGGGAAGPAVVPGGPSGVPYRTLGAGALALLLFLALRRRAPRFAAPAALVAAAAALPVGCGGGDSGAAPPSADGGGAAGDGGGDGGSTGAGGAGTGAASGAGGGSGAGGAGGAGTGGGSGAGGAGTGGTGGASGAGGASSGGAAGSGGAVVDGGSGGAGGASTGGAGGGALDAGSGGTSAGGGGGAGGASTGGSGGAPADAGTGGAPCGAVPCLPGEVAPGELGLWSSVATGARTVVASYDSVLGDLVLVELANGGESRRVVDGAPAAVPTHDPSGYRGGVAEPGPDVGAWPSARLAGDRVVVAYQDRDRGALRVAFEDAAGVFHPHDVHDSTEVGVEIGAYASLVLSPMPSIAYVATRPGTAGSVVTELRLATSEVPIPDMSWNWTTQVVDSAEAPAAAVKDAPVGPGLSVNLLVLSSGRRVLVHHDGARRALVAHVETAASSGVFTATVLDGGGGVDRGRWASAALDGAGVVHVAYEESLGHQVLYGTFTPGGALSAPEVVDDGTRVGDRPHPVGAGLTLWLDGTPRVAYQDAATADVVVATRSGAWAHADLATGAALDGFRMSASRSGAGPLVWDRLDPTRPGEHHLVIEPSP